MRVVVDTNVFVSSFFNPEGAPRGIIDLWKKGQLVLCVTEEILEEYIEVLARLGLSGESELEELLELFKRKESIIFTKSTQKLYVVEADPDDNKFIECAAEVQASCIVSGDKHLTEMKKFRDIIIIPPAEFINLFNVSSRRK